MSAEFENLSTSEWQNYHELIGHPLSQAQGARFLGRILLGVSAIVEAGSIILVGEGVINDDIVALSGGAIFGAIGYMAAKNSLRALSVIGLAIDNHPENPQQ